MTFLHDMVVKVFDRRGAANDAIKLFSANKSLDARTNKRSHRSAPVACPTNDASSLRARSLSSAFRRWRQSPSSNPKSLRHPFTSSARHRPRRSDSSRHMRWWRVLALCDISGDSASARTISSASCTMNSTNALASDCLRPSYLPPPRAFGFDSTGRARTL